MRRFFIDPSQVHHGCGLITDQEAKHICTVLRLRPGDSIELFDGTGMVHQAEITSLRKTGVETTILTSRRHQEPPPFLSLAQALIKGSKMDLIVQKATELGVAAIHPIITKHCDITTTSASQASRWQRIALEACKQCNRPTPPLCQPAVPLGQLLAHAAEFSHKIICWEDESTSALDAAALHAAERVLLLIGPEGGFTESEVEAAVSHGFKTVTLGPRILRAETAAIAGMAIVQFLLDNLRRPDI